MARFWLGPGPLSSRNLVTDAVADASGSVVQVKPDTIIQVWSGDSYNIDQVTSSGFRALFSTCWYLDYINYGQDWDKYYSCEQISQFIVTV